MAGPESSGGLPPDPPIDAAAGVEPAANPKGHRRPLRFGIVAGAVVVVLVILGIFVFFKVSAAISAGSGTATITWTPVDNGNGNSTPPQPFTGSIGGHSVSGLSTSPLPTNLTGPDALKNAVIFRYKGSFDGKSFNLGARIGGKTINTAVLIVTGTYDGQAIHAVLSPPANPTLNNPPIPFHGTIGKWKVKGVISGPTGSSHKQTATATYTVSS